MEGAVAPSEWILSRVCEEFSCLPSQALEEDASIVLSIIELRAYARAYQIVTREDTDEDTMRRSGLSEATIDRVMANVERASRGKH